MHDPLMAQLGMDNDQQQNGGQDSNSNNNNTYGNNNDGWVEISTNYTSSQHQSPVHEYGGFGFMQHQVSQPQSLPSEQPFSRIAPPPPPPTQVHQHLLPLIMPSHPTWPSMLTNPAGYQAPPIALPSSSSLPLKTGKLPPLHTPSPRKTLTDADRRRMCQYHEDNPTVKQTEIGGKEHSLKIIT